MSSKSEQVQAREEVVAATTEPGPGGSRAQEMLLDFLRDHDAACPVCGYNVRALTRPICPECKQELVLTVGAKRLRMGWLFIALAPGAFSGIAACFVLVMIIGRLLFGDGRMSVGLNAVDLFGWCSGVFAIMLAIRRNQFMAQSRSRQRWFAVIIWLIHITAFGLLLLLGPMYL